MRFLRLFFRRRRAKERVVAEVNRHSGALSDPGGVACSRGTGAAGRGEADSGGISALKRRRRGTVLGLMVLALALLATVGLRGLSGEGKPVRVKPRRNSGYWPAYIVYGFTQHQYASRPEQRGPARMYFMLPTLDADYPGNGYGNRVFTYRELLDHYRVSPEQFNRIPRRVPDRWMDEHMARLIE